MYHMPRCFYLTIFLSCFFILGIKPSFATLYNMTDLGAGGWYTATKMNNNGQVIGYRYFDTSGVKEPFLYTNGNFVNLSPYGIYPRGINNLGQVVGNNSNREVVIYENGVVTNLGDLGLCLPDVESINDNGQIVGVDHSKGYSAFLYDGSKAIYLYSSTKYQQTVAHDINNLNRVVGRNDVGCSDAQHNRIDPSFIYHNGNMTFFGNSGSTQAYAINDVGEAVGATSQFGNEYHAFLYNNGIMNNIDTLNSYSSLAIGINASGQIVGRFSAQHPGPSHAFIFEADSMKDLNLLLVDKSGFDYLSDATDINDIGQIVGIGYKSGKQHTFLLTPVPLPGAVLLLGAGLGRLVLFSRRKRTDKN